MLQLKLTLDVPYFGLQTIVRRAVIFLCHRTVWFKWILAARKPSFKSFFPLGFLFLPPFPNYSHEATSLCRLSPKHRLAWKNLYYPHQLERRKTKYLFWTISYGFFSPPSPMGTIWRKTAGPPSRMFVHVLWGATPTTKKSGLWQIPQMNPSQKRFAAILSLKRQRRIDFNTKEKNCTKEKNLLYLRRWPRASEKVHTIVLLRMTERRCCLTRSGCKGMES